MIKKILLSIASIFLIWQSYGLLLNLHRFETDAWGLIIFAAWVINMFITGIFAFAGFAFPTQQLLPQRYYKVHNPKRLKKIYAFLKVDVFRKMLLATIWKNKAQRKRFFNGKKDGIQNLITQSMKSEFGHLIPFIILIFISIYLIKIDSIGLAIFTFIINFIGNFYPIMLQRYHRMRIQIMFKRSQRNRTP